MRLFWKIFAGAVAITVLTFSAGSYLLISSLFSSSLSREVTAVTAENTALRTAYAAAVTTLPHNGRLSDEAAAELAGSLQLTGADGTLRFAVCTPRGAALYATGWRQLPETDLLLSSLSPDARGYTLCESSGSYLLTAACPLTVGDRTLYLAVQRDVTPVFSARADQYALFQRILIALTVLAGVLSGGLSYLLTRPLRSLTASARRLGEGDYKERAVLHSSDEIGELGREFNRMADRLEENIDKLREAVERQETFTGSFAHEIKTPLTSIIGYADLLRARSTEDELSLEAANYIVQEGKRLESLSHKLMELFVLKKQDFVLRRIHSADFAASVRAAVLPALVRADVRFTMAVENAYLTVEPDLLKTVFYNLIDNARKALPAGGKILFRGKRLPDGYQFTVQDNGRGMPKEELSRITEAFYMVDKSRGRSEGGAGLGLAICAEIVSLHHGLLQFESEPGAGTTVTVTLRGDTDETV